MLRFLAAALLVVLVLTPALRAQDRADLRRVVLVNGDVYVGYVADESADPIVIRTADGVERRFSRSEVEFVAPLIRGRFFRTDPVKTRLFAAPTARTLGGGEFRGDLTYVFPSITAGLSDRIDLLASGFVSFGEGSFATPLIGFKAQVYATESAQVAVGTSALFVLSDDVAAGAIPYAVATFGDETRAVSVGVGGLVGAASTEIEVAEGLIYGVGAETQINNGVKLFIETLGVIGFGGEQADIAEGLIAIPGVRFFGDRFALDVIGYVATDFQDVAGFAPIGGRVSYAF